MQFTKLINKDEKNETCERHNAFIQNRLTEYKNAIRIYNTYIK